MLVMRQIHNHSCVSDEGLGPLNYTNLLSEAVDHMASSMPMNIAITSFMPSDED